MAATKILVFQTAFLGDAILAIPLLKFLKYYFPQSELAFVCRKGVGEIFTQSGLVKECIEVDKSDSASLRNAFKLTQRFKADLIISPHRSFRTALWVWRLFAQETIGFRDWWTFFAYKKRKKYPEREHDVLRQLSLLTLLKMDVDFKKEELLDLKLDLPANLKYAYLKNFVALSPGSQWNTKRWIPEGFIKVAENIRTQGNSIVIVGAPNESELCAQVAQKLPGSINLCGQTSILELAQILSRAQTLICNDSGAMHVATAVGTPVVSIFGATVPAQGYAPWSKKSRVVEVNLSCRPCGAHGHDECPLGHHHCMTMVKPEMVLQALEGLNG